MPITPRHSVVRIGVVAVAAIVVAEGAVWLTRPDAPTIAPASVPERSYFSATELERASDFRGPQRLVALGALVVEGGVLIALALWRPAPVRRVLRVASRRPILGGAAIGAGISLALAVTALPLAILANERAIDFGLSTQSFGPWLADRARGVAIGAALAAAGGAVAVVLLRRLGSRFWIGGSLLVVGAAAMFTWLAPVVLAPVFNKFEALPAGWVRSDVLELARRAGVEIGDVYRVDASRRSTAINAYVDGLGSTRRVVLYDNTIRELSPAELRSVVAHELAHVKGNDVPRGLLFVALIAPLGVLFAQLSAEALTRRSGDDFRSPAALPALALSLALAAFALAIPGNRLSRAVESRADTFALELTRDPRAFIDLQRRLAVSNLADPTPPEALQAVFGTHPTTMDRIGTAEAYERSIRWGR
ncbi:MAG TPA: M48 family metalloprotease [Solirubrobacterales bacterium]